MPSYQFPVEAGQIALFVRAAGGSDVDVLDPGLTAPPTFVQSGAQFDPEWPFRPRPDQPWLGSGREPTGDPAAGDGSILHAEQHFEYFRPVRPGMVLTVTTEPGQTWVKRSRSGGELHFAEQRTEYRDEEGHLVVTARSVSVTPVFAPEPEETAKEQQ
jgi:N-terminal half of MaoC dehydratase